MREDHLTISSPAVFRLVTPEETSIELPVTLRYDSNDPYAVTMAFGQDDDATEWVCARELLADGLIVPMGEGDVRVQPGPAGSGLVLIELISTDGPVKFEAPTHLVADFLDRTYDVVFGGSEIHWISIDEGLATLLSGDQA